MAGSIVIAESSRAIIGILDSLSGLEFMVVALLAFLVLGPEKLPDAMRKLGRLLGEVRKVTSGFQEEVKAAMVEAEAATKLPEDFGMAPDRAEPDLPTSPVDTTDDDPPLVDEQS